ncbi:hypothetical protein NLJ89_g5717 [Agrocybe chaxingu]|uniref:Uncharacterized protein n=1 Tax=Agrocybe chaxingu TaxID=84603 RepID=A0A9W8K6V3_9AGAR|nr:hypothetical protein NLJ89_g5717 [Agrocybe chaxingu]
MPPSRFVPSDVIDFWKTAWNTHLQDKQPPWSFLEPVRRDAHADVNLEVPHQRWVVRMAETGLEYSDNPYTQIFVRDDYFEAFRDAFATAGYDASHIEKNITGPHFPNPFLQVHPTDAHPYSGFIVTGGPGIGKTLWLMLVLILRLHAGLPTIFQSRPNDIYFFHADGVVCVESVTTLGKRANNVWALVDSNAALQSVDKAFFQKGAFVVQAASPKDERINWVKGMTFLPKKFILAPWSLSELIAA